MIVQGQIYNHSYFYIIKNEQNEHFNLIYIIISGGRSQIKLYLEQVRIQNQSGNSHFGSLAHFGPYYSADDPFRMDWRVFDWHTESSKVWEGKTNRH